MSVLLAVDTSTQWIGLALYDGAQVIAESIWRTRNHHTVELAPAITALLSRCGIKPAELGALAVALGPGAYTSLRIGLALVKGMAIALRLPVIGVPSLDILAAAQPVQPIPLAAALQIGRGRLAVGWYAARRGKWTSQGDVSLLLVEELAQRITVPTLLCGELEAETRQMLGRKHKHIILASPAQSLRRPGYLAELAWARWRSGKVDDPVKLGPVYLHSTSAAPV